MSTHHVEAAVIAGQVTLTGTAVVASWSLRDDLSVLVSVCTLIIYAAMFVRWVKKSRRP